MVRYTLLALLLVLSACGGGNESAATVDARSRARAFQDKRLQLVLEAGCYVDPPSAKDLPAIADALCEAAAQLKRRPTRLELAGMLEAARPGVKAAALTPAEAVTVIDEVGWAVLLRNQAAFDKVFAPHVADYEALRTRLKQESPTAGEADEQLARFVLGRISDPQASANK